MTHPRPSQINRQRLVAALALASAAACMMERHHAEAPAEYAALQNPVASDAESLACGLALYTANCASCHGATGMGEGPAGKALNPAPIAHTSQMMSDGYLYWRISEGDHPFETAMPAWQDALDEQARWNLINTMRNLGTGAPMGRGQGMGCGQGMGQSAGGEAAHRAEMLAAAVARNAITQDNTCAIKWR